MESGTHNTSLLSRNNVSVDGPSLTDHFGPVETAIFGSWLVIIIVVSILGNLMVITVILRNKRMREAKNGTNIFLFNLAISDLMVGICMAPVSLNTLIHEEWRYPQWFCSMNSFLNTLFLFASTHTLMYMGIHKFLSVRRHSNGIKTPISRKICLVMVSAAWLWGAIFGILTVSGLSKAVYRPKKMQCGPLYPRFIPRDAILFFTNFICNIIVPIIIMGVTYRKIFHILHQSTLFREQTASGGQCFARRSEQGATRTLMLVLGIFLLCWLPYVVYVNYAFLLENKDEIPNYLNPLAYCSGFTNSICNPIIYAFRFQDFQKGYRDIFRSTTYIRARENRRMLTRQHRPSGESGDNHRMSVPKLPESD